MKKKLLITLFVFVLSLGLASCGKKSYDMSGIKFEDKTVQYNGSKHAITITGNLPEGVSVEYDGNDQVEIGEYEITANFKGDDSYETIKSMKAILTIESPHSAVLPGFDSESKGDIKSALNALGFDNVSFVDVFNVTKFPGSFLGYQGVNVGSEVNRDEEIVVLLSTRALPDITKIYADEIMDYFINAGVREENILAIPHPAGGDPEFGLGYVDFEVGDTYTTGVIKYYYNANQIKLRDLSGYSIYEVQAYLTRNNLEAEFYYTLDNSKEYDSFNSFVGHNIGDIINRGTNLMILLYENDNLDDEMQLFISKYVDVSVGTNGVELYNPTSSTINLADYYLSIFENGSFSETYHIELSGALASKATFFIASSTSHQDLISKADLVSDNLVFDGNDVIQLRKSSNNTYIDTVYNVGNMAFTLAEEIFIRREHITRGTRNFNFSEWAGFIPTFTEPIKTHPYEILNSPPFELLEDIFQDYGMTKIRYKSAADGDTVYAESLDPRDTARYDGDNRLRFLMVDTPETGKPGVEAQPYAEAASTFTRNALSTAAEIYIQADRAAGLKENYGRHLAYIWYNKGTISNPEWRLLNYDLVFNGLGTPAGIKDQRGEYKNTAVWGNRYMYQWVYDADLHARVNELGIHSGEHQD